MSARNMLRTATALLVVVVLGAARPCTAYARADTFENELYIDYDPDYCVRLLDRGGQTGCSSARGGNVGILRAVTDLDDFGAALDENIEYYETALLMHEATFYELFMSTKTEERRGRLYQSDKINGVVVVAGAAGKLSGSPELEEPNKGYNLHSGSYNHGGSGVLMDSIPFPIVRVSEEEGAALWTKAERKDGYAVELDYYMEGKYDAAKCLDFGMCQPIGGKSVWASVGGAAVDPARETVMLVAGADTTSMFHEAAVGAISDMSGALAVMLAARGLAGHTGAGTGLKNIVAALFTGESYGYAGSARFVEDLSSSTCLMRDDDVECPDTAFKALSLDKVAAVLEAKQVASATYTLWSEPWASADISALFPGVSAISSGVPPSSVQSFLKNQKSARAAHGVLTDHQSTYTNKCYHSSCDVTSGVDIDAVCGAATALGRAAYQLAGGDLDDLGSDWEVDCTDGQALLDCLTGQECTLSASLPDQYSAKTIPNSYAGVFQWDWTVAPTMEFVYRFLTDATATKREDTCSTDDDCGDANPRTVACINAQCVTGAAHYHDAVSPGFNYDYRTNTWTLKAETMESTWVESNWNTLSMRSFYTHSLLMQIGVLLGGCSVAIGSLLFFGLVWRASAWAEYTK